MALQYGQFGGGRERPALLNEYVAGAQGEALARAGAQVGSAAGRMEELVMRQREWDDKAALLDVQRRAIDLKERTLQDLQNPKNGYDPEEMEGVMGGVFKRFDMPKFHSVEAMNQANAWLEGAKMEALRSARGVGQNLSLSRYLKSRNALLDTLTASGRYEEARQVVNGDRGIGYTPEEADNAVFKIDLREADTEFQRLLANDPFTAMEEAERLGLVAKFEGRPDVVRQWEDRALHEQSKVEGVGARNFLDGELNGEKLTDDEVRLAAREPVKGVRLSPAVATRILANRASMREKTARMNEKAAEEARKTLFNPDDWVRVSRSMTELNRIMTDEAVTEEGRAEAAANMEKLLAMSQLTEMQRKEFKDRLGKLLSGDKQEKDAAKLRELRTKKLDDLFDSGDLIPGRHWKISREDSDDGKIEIKYDDLKALREIRYNIERKMEEWERLHPEATPEELDRQIDSVRQNFTDKGRVQSFKSTPAGVPQGKKVTQERTVQEVRFEDAKAVLEKDRKVRQGAWEEPVTAIQMSDAFDANGMPAGDGMPDDSGLLPPLDDHDRELLAADEGLYPVEDDWVRLMPENLKQFSEDQVVELAWIAGRPKTMKEANEIARKAEAMRAESLI